MLDAKDMRRVDFIASFSLPFADFKGFRIREVHRMLCTPLNQVIIDRSLRQMMKEHLVSVPAFYIDADLLSIFRHHLL